MVLLFQILKMIQKLLWNIYLSFVNILSEKNSLEYFFFNYDYFRTFKDVKKYYYEWWFMGENVFIFLNFIPFES